MMWEHKGIWFYIVTVEEVEKKIAVAEEIIQMVEEYCNQHLDNTLSELLNILLLDFFQAFSLFFPVLFP